MIVKVKVAACIIVETNGLFLMTEEIGNDGAYLTHPGGKLEENETLRECAERELFEETGYKAVAEGVVGFYSMHRQSNDARYITVCYYTNNVLSKGTAIESHRIKTHWLTADEILSGDVKGRFIPHRNPLVKQRLLDYINGNRYPNEIIKQFIF